MRIILPKLNTKSSQFNGEALRSGIRQRYQVFHFVFSVGLMPLAKSIGKEKA